MTKGDFLAQVTFGIERIFYDGTIGGSQIYLEFNPLAKENHWIVADGDHTTDFGENYGAAANYFYKTEIKVN